MIQPAWDGMGCGGSCWGWKGGQEVFSGEVVLEISLTNGKSQQGREVAWFGKGIPSRGSGTGRRGACAEPEGTGVAGMKAWKEEWKRVRLEIPARVRFDYCPGRSGDRGKISRKRATPSGVPFEGCLLWLDSGRFEEGPWGQQTHWEALDVPLSP